MYSLELLLGLCVVWMVLLALAILSERIKDSLFLSRGSSLRQEKEAAIEEAIRWLRASKKSAR
jgi:hypothetical protein